jgi:hypothetical protein
MHHTVLVLFVSLGEGRGAERRDRGREEQGGKDEEDD